MKKTILLLFVITSLLSCKSISEIKKIDAFGKIPTLIRQPYLQLVRQN